MLQELAGQQRRCHLCACNSCHCLSVCHLLSLHSRGNLSIRITYICNKVIPIPNTRAFHFIPPYYVLY